MLCSVTPFHTTTQHGTAYHSTPWHSIVHHPASPQEFAALNAQVKTYGVPGISWSQEEADVIKRAKVTHTSWMIMNTYKKVADPSTKSVAVAKIYMEFASALGGKMKDLHDGIQKKIGPLVSAS